MIYLPKAVHWEKGQAHLFLDPEAPHWIAVDSRGAQMIGWIEAGLPIGEIIPRYAATHGVETAKAWLHVHDFIRALLRAGFASMEPIHHQPYLGRSAYASPKELKELWLHTNNICNLACSHCLVGSAPWVKDWGLPAEILRDLIQQALGLGVERFYMTGGEPFMRKDIFDLIQFITEEKGRELILLTNATLFQGERLERLTGLSRQKLRFQVSLDGASPQTNDPIRGKGSFEAATEGLRILNSLGFQTSVTTVVTKTNLGELPKMTKLARTLGVPTQHLMWMHRRGRIMEHETELGFPPPQELIAAVRQVKTAAQEFGVQVDNIESIKQRVNSRPGVKYDLGNACWDSLCVYSDGTVYPSAALANIPSLALGSIKEGKSLESLWRESPVAENFRQASVVQKEHLKEDPFRYLTGGGDLEHSLWASGSLTGPDPYYSVYTAMVEEAIWELIEAKRRAVNRRSGYDVPRVLHAMGDGAIHCATDDLAVTGEIDVRTLHSNCVLAFDVDKPRKLVRQYYAEAAETPKAELCCPTKFDPDLVGHIPKEVVDRFYGCGSPVTLGGLISNETFLDLGSGAGIDCFIAAKFVGPQGRVIGIDMTQEMLKVANENRPIVAQNLGFDVVEFRRGYLEQVPVESKSVDLVTSNCVVNLSPDKPKVFSEIWRILKDNGRMVVADIVSDRPVPAALKVNPRLWGECIVGALTDEEFLSRLEEAGFYGLSILKKTYWKRVEGYDFYSVTVRGYKFEKTAGCQFIGQKAVYLGPLKAAIDEEGHLFPRNEVVEICTDTAAKLSKPPYAGSFVILEPNASKVEVAGAAGVTLASACGPGCC